MKKILLFSLIIAGIMLIGACKSTGAAVDKSLKAQDATEEAYQSVYNRYKKNLILDGAGSYTVQRGDTLSAISRTKYSDGFYYPVILLASDDVVLDPDKIEIGMELTVPDLQKNLNDSKARANIKSFLIDIAKVEDSRGRKDTADGIRNRANSL